MKLGRPRCDNAKLGFEQRKKMEKVREESNGKGEEEREKSWSLIYGYISSKKFGFWPPNLIKIEKFSLYFNFS